MRLMKAARSRLTGAAKNMYKYLGRQTGVKTWEEFKEQSKKTFMSEISVLEK